MTVSVIIPTYNERETIVRCIAQVRHTLRCHDLDHEIIVVDDDSPDGTCERVVNTYGDDEAVLWRRRVRERGLATAVLAGIDIAAGDVYVVIDADLQHPPERVAELVKAVQTGADIAIGTRTRDTGWVLGDIVRYHRSTGPGALDGLGPMRKLVSRGATALARLAVPAARDLEDPMSGFFAVRASVVEAARLRLDPIGYKILLELLARCDYERVAEIPYRFRPREDGESNFDWREAAKFLTHLARLQSARQRRTRQPSTRPNHATDGGER